MRDKPDYVVFLTCLIVSISGNLLFDLKKVTTCRHSQASVSSPTSNRPQYALPEGSREPEENERLKENTLFTPFISDCSLKIYTPADTPKKILGEPVQKVL